MKFSPLTTIAATLAAAAGALSASYWREVASWSSDADIDDWFARNSANVATMDPTDAEVEFGFAAVTVKRATEPPHRSYPYFWCFIATDFSEDEDGLRRVTTERGWAPTKRAAWDFVSSCSIDFDDAVSDLFDEPEEFDDTVE